MKALMINEQQDKTAINMVLTEKPAPTLTEKDSVLIKVCSVGVNPSDALAATGYFSHAVWPRIPGRDLCGQIVEGDDALKGRYVWATGGAAGIDMDGSLAEYVELKSNQFALLPENLDPKVAGGQVLAYVTAYYSLKTRAQIKAGEKVIVVGALGQVGQAAMMIAKWCGCEAIALVYGSESVKEAESRGWDARDTSKAMPDLEADVILNGIGNTIWPELMTALNPFGRLVTIGAQPNKREVLVNLFEMYRANQTLIGVNTVDLDFIANAKLLDEMAEGFNQGKLRSILNETNTTFYDFKDANEAFQKTLSREEKTKAVIQLA